MIRSFACKQTKKLFYDEFSKKFAGIERIARRKLMVLHAAGEVEDLRIPPGNRLEVLRGDRAGQHSIRVNQQWRLCFRWQDGAVWDVEIVDYH